MNMKFLKLQRTNSITNFPEVQEALPVLLKSRGSPGKPRHLIMWCKSGKQQSVAIMYLVKNIFERLGVRIADDPIHICKRDWKRLI